VCASRAVLTETNEVTHEHDFTPCHGERA
jgi:hypothetical protein